MAETLKNNLFINGLVCSSNAETARPFILVFPRVRSVSDIVWMFRKCIKHI